MNQYPYSFKVNCKYDDLISITSNMEISQNPPESTIDDYRCVGRICTIRTSGSKLYFITVNILNSENLINSQFQFVIAKQNLTNPDSIILAKQLGMGDIIGVIVFIGKTKVGESSLFVKEFTLLAPCLHEIPKEQYSISDYDVKYRKRYLDMITNQSTRYNLITRSKIIKYLRNYLDQMDFLEVETPILHTNYGGANAKPFITLHNDYKMNMYMRIAPELFLKQLVIGGMGKIYEIGKQFRNESIDKNHLPEFTSLELYWSLVDYTDMMKLCEDFFKSVVLYIHKNHKIMFKNHQLDFEKPFRQIDFLECLSEKTGYNFTGVDFTSQEIYKDLLDLLKKFDIKCSPPLTIPRILDKLCGHFIEPECIQPTFIIHHPKIMSPLAKPHRTNPLVTERFELFICENEYANAYTELNDPQIQKQAFDKQFDDKNLGDVEAQNPDMDFVTALEYGLVPTGGLGIGIDRLVMLLTGQESIREIITFPTMK
jgi:lysyl-tRNA synthetase class 2